VLNFELKVSEGDLLTHHGSLSEIITYPTRSQHSAVVWETKVGNVMGNPGVFRGNPHAFPCKTVPVCVGAGFDRNGSRVE
jgi:hypothetical protein